MRKQSSFCRSRPNQRHTARYHEYDGRIYYRYHPRHGQTVAILKQQRTRFEGLDVFVIRQPDGTLAHVPCWMMQEAAALHALCLAPQLPLAQLRDLRMEID